MENNNPDCKLRLWSKDNSGWRTKYVPNQQLIVINYNEKLN